MASSADELRPKRAWDEGQADRLRLLLVSDDVSGARLLKEVLSDLVEGQADVTWVATWSEAVAFLEGSPTDLVVFHLSGTNAIGLTAPLPDVPILVVTGLTEEDVGVRVLQPSTAGSILRSTFTTDLVMRSLRLGIERRRISDGRGQDDESMRLVPVPEHLKLSDGSVYALHEGND